MAKKPQTETSLPHLMEQAAKQPLEFPDPLVLAIFQNDFAKVIQMTRSVEYSDVTLTDLSVALDYKHIHIARNRIDAVVKKWGKR